jgi:site-specific recombinase XerD
MTELAVVHHGVLEPHQPAAGPGPAFYAQAFLAGYSGRTRESYETTLRQWGTWCLEHSVEVMAVQRAHVQVYARDLEQAGRAPATIAQKLSAVGGLYAYLVIEGVLPKNPVQHVRRPKVSDESPRFGLDKAELLQLLAIANTHSPEAHCLICLLALNGLRVSEVCGAGADDLDVELGHQVLAIIRKGGKKARVPLGTRTAQAVADLGRTADESLIGLDRYAAWRLVRQLVDEAGITKRISPHSLRHTFVTLALEAGAPLHIVQEAAGHADPRTTQRYNRGRKRLDNHATFALQTFLDQ